MTGERATVGEVVKRLRSITGHLSRRDREIVLTAVDALAELSARLYAIGNSRMTGQLSDIEAPAFSPASVGDATKDVIAEVTREVWADVVGRAEDEEGVNDGQEEERRQEEVLTSDV